MMKVTGLFFGYNGASVLENIDASVRRGSILSVVGPNGAGKTTLMKCIANILTNSSGQISVGGQDTSGISRMELARLLGYVPQNIPVRFPATVFETVLAGRRPYISWRPSQSDLEKTASVISEMKLSDLAMRDMNQLSGGQAQKVLLARALAQDTDFLLLDEPTSSLDLRHQLEMLETITTLAKTKGLGVMMAMHDLNLAARFSDTILMLHKGRVFCSGTPLEVITPENISEVYGVEASVRMENGYLQIQPLRCAEKGSPGEEAAPPSIYDTRSNP